MFISFMLLDNDGNPVLNGANTAKIYLSKDGAPFELTDISANETGSGLYNANIPEDQLTCIYSVLILVQADGCQNTVYEYTPSVKAGDVADAVWNAKDRTLTSLNVGNPRANQIFTSRKTTTQPQSSKQGLSVKQILGGK